MRRWASTLTLVAVVASWFSASPGAAQTTCSGATCAKLAVGSASGKSGDTVTIPITFTQGPTDGQSGQGSDEIAAIAFTVGMPGVGSAVPLTLNDCTVGTDGLTPSIKVADGIKNTFKVVIENLQCTTTSGTPRNRCLCPDSGQQRDNFINVVVYGPKELPSSGPVDIPVLPSGQLLSIDFKIGAGASTTPLHAFAETDNQTSEPKPQFGAFLSIGDKAAIDQTFNRTAQPNESKIEIDDGEVTVQGGCLGDCDELGAVTVDELVKGVNIALGNADISTCPSFDENSDTQVTVDELVKAVGFALNGCP